MSQTQTMTPQTTIVGDPMPLAPSTDDQARTDGPKRSLFGFLRRAKPDQGEPAEPVELVELPELLLKDHESGQDLDFDTGHLEVDDLFAGNVLTFQDGSGKHNFVIQEVQGELPSPITLRLNPARSNMHKSFLLLAILAGTWFLVSWLIKLVF